MPRIAMSCVLLSLFLLTVPALADDVPEHPLIRPYPGSVLATAMSKHRNFDGHEFYVTGPDGRRQKKMVRGEYWRLLYELRTPEGERVRNVSKMEFLENYRVAAEEKGGGVVYEDQAMMIFTLPRDDGGITWCKVAGAANLGQQDLVIVDEKPLKTKLAFGPAELKAALDRDGKIALYGIHFDTDKATLKPEATEQLQHIVMLLLQYPELRLEVQGHTDSEGSEEHNLDLSQRRAASVQAWLALYGIQETRLTPRGLGESQPVASNDSEEGRAKNRRVELVKR